MGIAGLAFLLSREQPCVLTILASPVLICERRELSALYSKRNRCLTLIISNQRWREANLECLSIYTGADVIKNDGIYSRYFFSFPVSGRYSLTVRACHSPSNSTLAHSVPGSHAMYVPGYIANGKNHLHSECVQYLCVCVHARVCEDKGKKEKKRRGGETNARLSEVDRRRKRPERDMEF